MKTSPPQLAGIIQALRSLMRPARAEKGFISCQLLLEAGDANAICYEERWQTREDFEEQVKSARMTRLLTLMESATEPPSLEFHFVSETHGLEYIAAVRGESELFSASKSTTKKQHHV